MSFLQIPLGHHRMYASVDSAHVALDVAAHRHHGLVAAGRVGLAQGSRGWNSNARTVFLYLARFMDQPRYLGLNFVASFRLTGHIRLQWLRPTSMTAGAVEHGDQ